MKFVKTGFVILAGALLFTACNEASVDYKKTKGGVAYKLIPAGKSKDSIKTGNIIKYNMILKVESNGKDSMIYNSYEMMPKYDEVRPGEGLYTDNVLHEIFVQAHVGDSIYYEQSVDSFLAKQPDLALNSSLKKGDKLITSAKILQVFANSADAQTDSQKEYEKNKDRITKAEARDYEKRMKAGLENFSKNPGAQNQLQIDKKVIEEYLASKNIKTDKTDWGVYIERLSPGQGEKPTYGQFAQVKYKGMHLNGEVFDEGVYPVEIGKSQVVFGFMDAIMALKKGEKARVYIPSLFGYGAQGSPPKIQPNENLMFEMEIVDLSNTPPQQPSMPMPDTGDHSGHNH